MMSIREARKKLEEDYKNGIVRPEPVYLSNDEISSLILGKTLNEAKEAVPKYYFEDITSGGYRTLSIEYRRINVKLDENGRITKFNVG